MLSVKSVSKNFGGFQAVNQCSFDIKPGKITGIIGPNGAGKSTMFNMIAGEFAPTSGKIWFDEQDITGLAPYRLFRKGLVRTFQIPHEFDELSAIENLLIVNNHHLGERVWGNFFQRRTMEVQERNLIEKAEKILDFLGLLELRDAPAGKLSGGQKKLLELGRTLMVDAKLVLLDEPAAGVNRTLLGKIIELISKMHQEYGLTVCLIEHDMNLISKLCHHVICMAEGKVLLEGSYSEVTKNKEVLESYLGKVGE